MSGALNYLEESPARSHLEMSTPKSTSDWSVVECAAILDSVPETVFVAIDSICSSVTLSIGKHSSAILTNVMPTSQSMSLD